MSDNVKNANHRLKPLYLYKILLERTDEEHSITMPEIISQLENYGITAARKALYEDIEELKVFGIDIVSGRGMNAGYKVVNRDFELPELKLLADAVSSSRFLTEKKSAELILFLNQPIDKVYRLLPPLCGGSGEAARKPFNTNSVKTKGFDLPSFRRLSL